MRLIDRFRQLFRPAPQIETQPAAAPSAGLARPVVDHVILLDGTMASLREEERSHAGLHYQMLREGGAGRRTLYYDPGIPWRGWRHIMDVVQGRGVDEQIMRAYGYLASHYRPGDRIFLFGYSRGAFAVRSLAGVIARVGLLRHEAATERNLRLAWRYYRMGHQSPAVTIFQRRFCHMAAPIRMVGVWDTVKALGWRLPLLWLLTEKRYAFHDTHLGANVDYGFQALALDETRAVLAPLLWQMPPPPVEGGQAAPPHARLEQVWFRGAHGDIGGQLGRFEAARPLANIPLVWMLDRAEMVGLHLPAGWRLRFPCDPNAPMLGSWRGLGALFLYRKRRHLGRDPSERLHESVPLRQRLRWPRFGAQPRGDDRRAASPPQPSPGPPKAAPAADYSAGDVVAMSKPGLLAQRSK